MLFFFLIGCVNKCVFYGIQELMIERSSLICRHCGSVIDVCSPICSSREAVSGNQTRDKSALMEKLSNAVEDLDFNKVLDEVMTEMDKLKLEKEEAHLGRVLAETELEKARRQISTLRKEKVMLGHVFPFALLNVCLDAISFFFRVNVPFH